jgi:hypothetical protein
LSPTEFINVPSSNSSKKLKIEVEENLFESGTSEDVILNLTQEKNKDDSSKKSEVKCPDFIVGKYCEKRKLFLEAALTMIDIIRLSNLLLIN